MIRPTRNTELENSMDLFSGGRAISENLQLNRELRLSTDEQNRTSQSHRLPELQSMRYMEGVDEG